MTYLRPHLWPLHSVQPWPRPAIMATKINMRKEILSFASVLTMVLAIGLVSGYIQTQGYMAHGVQSSQAAIMGFGVPLAGEFLLALALAIYIGAIKRTKIHDADTALEVKVGEAIADVMTQIDVSSSAKYVEKKIATVVRFKADEMLAQWIPAETELPQNAPKSTDAETEARAEPGMNQAKAERGRQAQRKNAESRQTALLNMLSADYGGADIDALTRQRLRDNLAQRPEQSVVTLRHCGVVASLMV